MFICFPGPQLQVNCVVMRGTNEDELCDFVALTENKVSHDGSDQSYSKYSGKQEQANSLDQDQTVCGAV